MIVTEIIHVKVLKEDIKNGVRNSVKECPVALAIKRSLSVNVEVECPDVWIDNCYYTLPEKAVKFVERFDEGKRVNSFKFELEKRVSGIEIEKLN